MIKDDPASLSKDLKPIYDGSLEKQYYRVLGHLKPEILKETKIYDSKNPKSNRKNPN